MLSVSGNIQTLEIFLSWCYGWGVAPKLHLSHAKLLSQRAAVEAHPRNVGVYVLPDGTCPFDEWMDNLRDLKAKAQIEIRINRLRRGLLGDFGSVGEGIIELKIHYGPGYRIYCVDDEANVLILWGSSKGRQEADVSRAKLYWREYKG